MGFLGDFFHRGGRVVRGQANQAMTALEDANFEATVRQTVADMRTELNNAVRASAMAMSNYNRLEAEYQKYVRQSQEWKDRASLALDASNEDLARKALAKKGEADKVGELKSKIDEGERTATTLVARKNAAQAQRKVAEALAGAGNADNAFAQLNHFEESVAQEEATAKAFNQIGNAGQDENLEKQFAALSGHSVDSELEALKRERQIKPPELPKELPSGEK